MPIEIELKLKMAATDIPQLKALPLLKNHVLLQEHLVTTYFDTPQQELRKRGFVLRIREINNTFLQTVKTSTASKNGLHEREEWEQYVQQIVPDYQLIPDAVLKDELLNSELGRRVIPLFKSDFYRTHWHLINDASDEVELALDEGFVSSGQLQDTFCEIELELKKGAVTSLQQFANDLAKHISLTPENISKAGRGYRLATLSNTAKSG